MSDWLSILAVLALVGVNAFLVVGEYAVVTARRAALAVRAEEGSAGARAALRLMDDPVRVISTVQVGITAVGILIGAIGEPPGGDERRQPRAQLASVHVDERQRLHDRHRARRGRRPDELGVAARVHGAADQRHLGAVRGRRAPWLSGAAHPRRTRRPIRRTNR